MRLSIIGLPGSGKTTLANLLGGMFKTMNISSGDLARAHGFAGSKAEETGQLDPDEGKIRSLVQEAIDGSNAYILDGFPRMVEQIEAVNIELDAVIYLAAGPVVCNERLLARGRPDDVIDIISARTSTYLRHTLPLVGYFDDKKKLIEINANGTIASTLGKTVVALSKNGDIEARNMIDDLRVYTNWSGRKNEEHLQ